VLGYLPQEFGYCPNYTATEFLMYIAALKGIPRDIAKRKARELETSGWDMSIQCIKLIAVAPMNMLQAEIYQYTLLCNFVSPLRFGWHKADVHRTSCDPCFLPYESS
jgi:hypothetical protein